MFKPVSLKPARYLLVLALLVSMAVGLTNRSVYASADKVTICHKPGTPAEMTLEVASSAVNAHLGHGDRTGECASTVSAGCAALNALVPDPQTNPAFYLFIPSGLTFSPGETIHASITASTNDSADLYVGAGVLDANGVPLVVDEHYADGTTTASVNYTVVAGDNAGGAGVVASNFASGLNVVSVQISCTPAR